MSDGIKYWIIYVEGIGNNGKELFPVTYEGKRIIWEYLIETVEENFNLQSVHFNGYNEITKIQYDSYTLK